MSHQCQARLLGVACLSHIGGMPYSHNGKTTTTDGGELLLTWTYLPPSKPEVCDCVGCTTTGDCIAPKGGR